MARIIICCLFLYGTLFPQTRVVINEFMASNKTSYKDPKYLEYSDWVEIYNAGTDQVNLKGYYLTDDLTNKTKWQFVRNVLLDPGEFYIFWCDDADTLNHTSFGLSADGENLGLYYPDGSVADTLTFSLQKTDISFGRFPDGGEDWVFYTRPTPGMMNDTLINKEIVANPVFSVKSGFFYSPQQITITHPDPAVKIYYSTDGSQPDTSGSSLYSGPINISSSTVVRAIAYKDDCIPSKTVTNSYFINETTSLPVVSISTDPANLFDPKIGIYVIGTNGIMGYCAKGPRNWNQDWERPVHLEFFETDKTLGFEIDAGIKIGGGCTRLYPQKPLAIFTRSIYGDSKIKYKLFPDKKIKEYNNIALRNSGQDWYRTLLRDGLMQNIVKGQMDVDLQAYRPGVVFLNGVYWGIYDIREKHNEHYLAANYNLDPDSIDIASGYVSSGKIDVNAGSGNHFVNMIKYMETHDLAQPQYYKYITTQMDIDEYIDYFILQIFYANGDWPGGNIKFWRPQRPDGKWRWIVFDLDMGMGSHGYGKVTSNTLHYASSTSSEFYANPPASTFQFRSLLKNNEFRSKLISRFAYHLNTTFAKERLFWFIDSMKNEISAEIPRHINNFVVTSYKDSISWAKSCSYDKGSWESNFQTLYEFAEQRHDYVRQHIIDKFQLPGTAQLTIINSGPGGTVFYENNEIKSDTLSGIFFRGVPMQLSVAYREGFRFKGWKGAIESESDTVSIAISGNSVLIAEFEKVTSDIQTAENLHSFVLEQNYPNPFNPSTTIKYQVGDAAKTTLKIYDLLGGEVAQLVDEIKNPGVYSVELNAAALPSGIYFYQLKSGTHSAVKKMILLK